MLVKSLEAFHDRLANFANSGVRESLSDNLHLAGTARHNLGIRHKRRILTLALTHQNPDARKDMPAAWERIVPYHNHSELGHVNRLAADVNCRVPFSYAETLPKDNGERFFSECLTAVKPLTKKYDDMDCCLCATCTTTDVANRKAAPPAVQQLEQPLAQTVNNVQQERPPPTATTPAPRRLTNVPPTPMHNFQQNWMAIQPMPIPMYFAPPPVCCGRHMQWKRKPKGCPPHDLHCQNRSRPTEQRAPVAHGGGCYFGANQRLDFTV